MLKNLHHWEIGLYPQVASASGKSLWVFLIYVKVSFSVFLYIFRHRHYGGNDDPRNNRN